MRIGERIRHLRKKHGVTQEGLAESVGVSYQMVQQYEAADDLKISKLGKIAAALGEPVAAFLADEQGDEVRQLEEVAGLSDREHAWLARMPAEEAQAELEQLLELDDEGRQLAAIWRDLSEDGRAEVMGEALKQQRRDVARRKG